MDYQVSESQTLSPEANAPLSYTQSNDLSSNINWDLTFAPIRKLYTYWNRRGHNEYNFISNTTKSTLNETYHADFIPIDKITTSINHDRQETLTVFTALGNPKTERTTANVRFSPYSNTAINISGSKDDSIQETRN